MLKTCWLDSPICNIYIFDYLIWNHNLPTKVRLVKAMVFPVVMYGCESWTVKKAEHRKIDAFELWCWRRLLRVPWTARRSNQSILKQISPGVHWKDWCWSWNSNTSATSCEELTHWKRPWCWEGLGAGGEGNNRGRDGWVASLTRWAWVWVNSGSWWWTGRPGVLRFMGSQRVRHKWETELNWTESETTVAHSFMQYFIWFLVFIILKKQLLCKSPITFVGGVCWDKYMKLIFEKLPGMVCSLRLGWEHWKSLPQCFWVGQSWSIKMTGAAAWKEPRCHKTSRAWNSFKQVQFIDSCIHVQKTIKTLIWDIHFLIPWSTILY